jgi:hypothetical protein
MAATLPPLPEIPKPVLKIPADEPDLIALPWAPQDLPKVINYLHQRIAALEARERAFDELINNQRAP